MPTRANGRPAVAMRRLDGDHWVPHGILVLDIDGELIGGLDTFLDPSLLAVFEATP
jgi:hypothetical protein